MEPLIIQVRELNKEKGMKRELDRAIEAISYFLSGTFMLQLLYDKTFDSLPARVRIGIEYSGKAFLLLGAFFAFISIPWVFKFKWVKSVYDKTYELSVFILFLAGLTAVVVTGLPRYPLITVFFFYLIMITILILEIRQIKKTVEIEARSLEGLRKLFLAAGTPLLWMKFLSWFFEVELNFDKVILIAGILMTSLGVLAQLIIWFQSVRERIVKRANQAKV